MATKKTSSQTEASPVEVKVVKQQSSIKTVVLKAEEFGFSKDFEVSVDLAAIADDFELGEAVGRYDIGQFGYSFIILERLIGKEKYDEVKELSRLSNGRVSTEKVDLICTRIFKDLNLKN